MRVFVPVLIAAAAILGLQSCKSKGSEAVVAAPTQGTLGALRNDRGPHRHVVLLHG